MVASYREESHLATHQYPRWIVMVGSEQLGSFDVVGDVKLLVCTVKRKR